MFSIGIRPDGKSAGDPVEMTHLLCGASGKTYTCNVVGPATVFLTLKDHRVEQKAEAGETAFLAMIGTKVRCEMARPDAAASAAASG